MRLAQRWDAEYHGTHPASHCLFSRLRFPPPVQLAKPEVSAGERKGYFFFIYGTGSCTVRTVDRVAQHVENADTVLAIDFEKGTGGLDLQKESCRLCAASLFPRPGSYDLTSRRPRRRLQHLCGKIVVCTQDPTSARVTGQRRCAELDRGPNSTMQRGVKERSVHVLC